jgi:hypothetical protein
MAERTQHARPPHTERHVRRAGTWLTRARFGPLALVLAGLLGLGSGAATSVALGRTAQLRVGAVVVAAGQASTGGTPSTNPSSPTPTTGSTPAGPFIDPLADLVPDASVQAEPVPDVPADDRMAGLLSLDTPTSADGDLVIVPGSSPAPNPDAPVRTVRVEVESGLPVDGERFARLVMGILNDPRSWGHDGAMSFARTDGSADIRVVLASPDKVDAMCAPLTTRGEYSCGRYGHAAINYTRWVMGADGFDDMTQYRQYVVNHEVGHLLGHQHTGCPGAGRLAPIMQQQTIAVAPCLPNGWPYPDRV